MIATVQQQRARGAMAVQRQTQITNKIQLKSIDFLMVSLYDCAHSSWLLLDRVRFSLPHNPLVLGSIPSCPTLFSISRHSFGAFCWIMDILMFHPIFDFGGEMGELIATIHNNRQYHVYRLLPGLHSAAKLQSMYSA